MSGFIGKGNVYFNPLVSGSYTGMIDLGNCTSFSLTEVGEQVTRDSRQRATAGQALSTITRKKPSEFAITWDEQGNEDNVTLSTHGTLADLTQASGSAATATVVLVLNKWVEIADGVRNVDNVLISGKIEGTDFDVNERLGLIRALNSGGAGSKTVTYDKKARAGKLITAGTQVTIRGKFLLDGLNEDGETPIIVDVWDAVVQSASAFDPLSPEFATGQMSGFMNTPSGRSGPYQIQMKIVDS